MASYHKKGDINNKLPSTISKPINLQGRYSSLAHYGVLENPETCLCSFIYQNGGCLMEEAEDLSVGTTSIKLR